MLQRPADCRQWPTPARRAELLSPGRKSWVGVSKKQSADEARSLRRGRPEAHATRKHKKKFVTKEPSTSLLCRAGRLPPVSSTTPRIRHGCEAIDEEFGAIHDIGRISSAHNLEKQQVPAWSPVHHHSI